jgi:hypothetical protein
MESRSPRNLESVRLPSVNPDVFARVVVALTRVTAIAERLLDGDAEGHVRRSIEEFAAAFARQDALEPAVSRLRASILMLHESRRGGRRRAYEHDKLLIGELDRAIDERLVPELRRIGFGV